MTDRGFDWTEYEKCKHISDLPAAAVADIKTERQWALAGYVPLDEEKGVRLWSNHFHSGHYRYLHPSEVRPAREGELDLFLEHVRKEKRERERTRRKRKKEDEKKMREQWAAWEKERACAFAREEYLKKCHAAAGLPVAGNIITAESIVLDVETTGLSSERDELLQISILDAADGSVLFNSYIKPVVAKEWPEAMAVNGITPEMVANAPEMMDLIPTINHIIKNAKKIIAYNLSFDVGFLTAFGVDFSAIECYEDVMEEFAVIYGDWNDYHRSFTWKSLSVCADFLGYTWDEHDAHNSVEDCRATLYCYNKMIEPEYQKRYEENIGLYCNEK